MLDLANLKHNPILKLSCFMTPVKVGNQKLQARANPSTNQHQQSSYKQATSNDVVLDCRFSTIAILFDPKQPTQKKTLKHRHQTIVASLRAATVSSRATNLTLHRSASIKKTLTNVQFLRNVQLITCTNQYDMARIE
ncbi:hypothetical protein M758_6G011200 [Ceratodon purpureus]|nr:hypothetical protein M758_6G011200 [Ceratodon purpureus]